MDDMSFILFAATAGSDGGSAQQAVFDRTTPVFDSTDPVFDDTSAG